MKTVAIVGAAHIHTPDFLKRLKARSGSVRVKSVWDHDKARADKNAAACGGVAVAEVGSIFADPEVDGVIVCSETNRHEALVLAATAAGKALFVEKPLGMGARDSLRMADAIERAGVIFQTGYFMRSSPDNRFLKQQVEAGAFGKITRVRGSNCHSGALGGWFDTDWRWMADPGVAGCGAFGDLGTHALDILMWLIGDVASVAASVGVAVGRYEGCDEFGEGLLLFENGVVGTLAAGWADVSNPVSLEIAGTEGHAYIRHGELFFQSKHVEGADGKQPWKALPEPMAHAFDLFLDALEGRSVPLITVRAAAMRSAVVEAMYEAAARKTWVALAKT